MNRKKIIYLLVLIPFFGFAQEKINEVEKVTELDDIIITASRKKESIKEVTSSVTIVGEKKIQNQSLVNSNIASILQYTVPGLATSSNQTSNYGQTLRGRPFLVMIDGIPQSTPLRNGGRDLQVIDPASIERIEVIKGATSIYGNGADGGIINYITKKNRKEKIIMGSVASSFTAQPASFDQTLGFRTSISLNGKHNRFDYVLGLTHEQTGLLKDANSVNISPTYSLANMNTYNGLIKIGYEISENQRIEASYIGYASKSFLNQDVKIGKWGVTPTIGIAAADRLGTPEGTPRNHNLRLSYSNSSIWNGTSLNVNAYSQDFRTVFYYDKIQFLNGGQSNVTSKKIGLRANFDSRLFSKENYKADLIYGIDLLQDATVQKLEDGRFWTPQMNMQNTAPFALVKFDAWNKFTLKAGARYENIKVEVDDFNTLPVLNTKTNTYTPSIFVEGGNLEYNALVWNVGVRYNVLPALNVFSSYSQSFSINEIGRILRSATTSVVSKLPTDPIIVNNYEVGLAGSPKRWFNYEVTSFWSTSKLGASSVQNTDGSYAMQRAPEYIWGYEAIINFKPLDYLSFGGAFAWIEGKVDNDNDDSYEKYINGSRIMAPKVTGNVQIQPLKNWDVELSVLHNFERDRFSSDPATNKYSFNEGPVQKYTIFNFSSSYVINKHIKTSFGVENLFNKDYSPNIAWWMARDQDYVKSPGRRVSLQLQYSF
ncbi:TonB-dependent receptor [Flavobacterium rhamnosiphilum]|uniref:TonB-dependent receptor n=1 Tax=Flavobacterium rhamnosiphilum TaxID=2541724 RepID=A0A4R5F746_9FLAO|nr:TonB-dependent receptor [Flavobacterium rhamnosiphilum]TDE43789.1 TonB-dependent receptor [Flavobacterium rhamnosiphilum]